MKVIWFNSEINYYQSGTWRDYSQTRETSSNPDNILILERFNHESFNVLTKIVSELNKCRKKSKIPR